MSILLSSKTLWMFFSLHLKMMLRGFQLIFITRDQSNLKSKQFNFLYNQCKFCESKKCYVICSLQVRSIGIIVHINSLIMVIFHFWVERCRKYTSHQKSFKQKLFGIEFCPKKSASAYVISPHGVELGGSKDWQVRSIILQGNSKLHSIQGSTLPKTHIASKKASNKSFSKWKFVQKSP